MGTVKEIEYRKSTPEVRDNVLTPKVRQKKSYFWGAV